MARTVRYGNLDTLVGLTFGADALVNVNALAVVGTITNSASSPNQVLSYQGLTGTLGNVFIAMNSVSFKVTAVSDASDSLTIDTFVGQTLVGELNFTICGFSAAGIALAAMPLDSLVSQSGNLPGLAGSLFMLGVNAARAQSHAFDFGIGSAYAFICGASVHYATTANPVIQGGTGPQMLIGLSGDDQITAGPAKTVIQAGPGNDTIQAGAGADTIYAGSGHDTIFGGSGGMTLIGGSGAMTVHPGTGQAIMAAGEGVDSFVFAPGHTGGMTLATADVIQKFHANPSNTIDLSAFDALLPAGGPAHLSFIGTAAFDHQPGEVRYAVTTTGVRVFGDVNGDGLADFTLTLTKLTSIAAQDFVL